MYRGKSFQKLSLPSDEESKKLVVVDTHKGLFHYIRLPYEVSSAPKIFRRLMENVLHCLSVSIYIYIDDMLVMGATDEKYLKRLLLVLD